MASESWISPINWSFILLFSTVFLARQSVSGSGVPVLIWESSGSSEKAVPSPALVPLTSDDFSNRLVKKVHAHKPLVVIFVEETLSVEDFSWRDETHKGAFPSLQNISEMTSKVEFVPSVQNPLAALKDLVQSQDYLYYKYDRNNVKTKPGTILEVDLPDPTTSEDRPQLLRRHDALIAQIYSNLLPSAPRVLALFTGRQSSWVEAESNRVRRQVSEDAGNSTEAPKQITYRGKDILIQTNAEPLLQGKDYKITLTGEPQFQSDTRNIFSRIIVNYNVNNEKITIRFKFPTENKKWKLSEVELEKGSSAPLSLNPETSEWIPYGQSFKTNKDFIFKSADGLTNLTFYGFLAEKFSVVSSELKFSATSDNDSGTVFFTPGIWMGLVVSFVLVIILAWGITMLMDIKTMDRFDDPKGKTISVTATD